MQYTLTRDEFNKRFEHQYKNKNLHLEERIVVEADEEFLTELLGPATEVEPQDFDAAGPIAVWMLGDEHNLAILILHLSLTPQRADLNARKYQPGLDKHEWSSLDTLKFLPTALFRRVIWVYHYACPERLFELGYELEGAFIPIYYCSTKEDAQQLTEKLQRLGAADEYKTREFIDKPKRKKQPETPQS